MTTNTLTWSGTLVVRHCWCGIGHAIPSSLSDTLDRNHKQNAYCPLGHSYVSAGETEAQRLQKELDRALNRTAAERARADQIEARLRATKGHVTRLRKQVLAGECPFCGQHLRDLERHITRQHPNEPAEEAVSA